MRGLEPQVPTQPIPEINLSEVRESFSHVRSFATRLLDVLQKFRNNEKNLSNKLQRAGISLTDVIDSEPKRLLPGEQLRK